MPISDDFRALMAGVCSPVAIVTVTDEGKPYGVTVSSLASLSLTPPMVTVALVRGSSVLARIVSAGRFAVNVLRDNQSDVATLFATRDADRFGGTPWHYEDGLPYLAGSIGFAGCDLHKTVDGGDHILLFGLITHIVNDEGLPLVYGRRKYGTHSHLLASAGLI